MAQNLPAEIDTEIAAEESQPILIYEIYLDAGTLRYAATIGDVLFPLAGTRIISTGDTRIISTGDTRIIQYEAAYTYYAKAIQLSNIKYSTEGQIVRASIQVDNISQDMHGYNAVEKFDGKTIIIKKIYRNILESSTYYREIFNGFIEEPKSVDKRWMVIDIVSGTPLQRKVLQEYYQKECNNIFGDSRCNKDGFADLTVLKITSEADSGTISTLVDSALTDVDEYWSFGKINVLVSGTIYRRRINSFDADTDTLTFDVSLPVAVESGCSYTLYKGCPKTWNACKATYDYGPSADNKANFNGFIHIGKQQHTFGT